MLVRLRREYRAQLRADFRQYYGCSFDYVYNESVIEAADLTFMLPRGSRTFKAIDPETAWEQSHYLLARIANELMQIGWMLSEDGQKKRNRPKPIMPPSAEDERNVYDVDTYRELLSRPRKEV